MPARKQKGNPRGTLQDEQCLTMDKRIGQRVKTIRLTHNSKYEDDFVSQETLAHDAGVAHNTYNRIENGKTSAQLLTLEKIATFWKMSVQEMLKDIPTPTIAETFNAPRIKRILEGSNR